ncbi:MAG TPA: NAD-dependent epimerase/dehydratase family protein [Segeticoccus sp.]|uniref:NAD-dependent epimerase/dehydratase family protein n=1 Tax=Segeticoccus sp. TaxID=2706531 RepID=UPI002D80E43F|nr:NAD-dependent epimerase/dehydratase family protein [Segeticoccus sp.]HET8601611.1 NAD-dependent epimerase/dehydratase family protein [Segeticoccus sp.]
MKVLVLGGDGYLGWPTSLHLSDAGHDVTIADSLVRRRIDTELGVRSLVPIASPDERVAAWREVSGKRIGWCDVDVCDADALQDLLATVHPDAVIHFAEQRSAPYSMMNREHAVYTQQNNVVGTLNLLYAIAEVDPDIHLIKLGSMGEYGTPDIDIEEGWLDVEYRGRRDRVLFPKRPGSFYHLSKVHDSHNIEFACRVWALRATDLNQGVVYGQSTAQTVQDDRLETRFDYDAVFGTVLNRFIIQAALGEPLTVYGSGGQVRGFIDLRDTCECLRLAVENPADRGEFRVFNQLTETFSVAQLARTVARVCTDEVEIVTLDNPRVERESHYYNVVHTALPALGLRPHLLSDTVIESLLPLARQHAHRVDRQALQPAIRWTGAVGRPLAADGRGPQSTDAAGR